MKIGITLPNVVPNTEGRALRDDDFAACGLRLRGRDARLDETAVADRIAEVTAAGADEIVLAPCSSALEPVDRLADVAVARAVLV